jgi:hypothetical protein
MPPLDNSARLKFNNNPAGQLANIQVREHLRQVHAFESLDRFDFNDDCPIDQ